jgi:hypothetical protein
MPFQLNPNEITKAARDKRISFADQDDHSVMGKALSNTQSMREKKEEERKQSYKVFSQYCNLKALKDR